MIIIKIHMSNTRPPSADMNAEAVVINELTITFTDPPDPPPLNSQNESSASDDIWERLKGIQKMRPFYNCVLDTLP